MILWQIQLTLPSFSKFDHHSGLIWIIVIIRMSASKSDHYHRQDHQYEHHLPHQDHRHNQDHPHSSRIIISRIISIRIILIWIIIILSWSSLSGSPVSGLSLSESSASINSGPAPSVWESQFDADDQKSVGHLSPGLVLQKHPGQRQASCTRVNEPSFLWPTHFPSKLFLILALGQKPSQNHTFLTGTVAPRPAPASFGSLSDASFVQLCRWM